MRRWVCVLSVAMAGCQTVIPTIDAALDPDAELEADAFVPGGDGAPMDGGVDGGPVTDAEIEIDAPPPPPDAAEIGPFDAGGPDVFQFRDAGPSPDAADPDAATIHDAGGADATAPCMGVADGLRCPGSNDPGGAERCLADECVGTFVAPPSVGSNGNPGTRAQPKATIAGALATADLLPGADTVYIGTNAGAPALYTEDLVIPADVSLSGGWQRSGAGQWTRDIGSNRTELRSTGPEGLRFDPAGVTRSVVVSGMRITGADNATGATNAITITARCSPTLDQDVVVGGASTTDTGVGIFIAGEPGLIPHPLIMRSSITGGTGADSYAIEIGGGKIELQSDFVTGGTASGSSHGFSCIGNCPGTVIEGGSYSGGAALLAEGIFITGETTGITITRSTITGGPAGSNIATGNRTALHVESCTGSAVRVAFTSIIGVHGGGVDVARGVDARNCDLEVRSSPIVAGVSPLPGVVSQGSDIHGIECEDGTFCTLLDNPEVVAARSIGNLHAETTSSGVGTLLQGDGFVARNTFIGGVCSSAFPAATVYGARVMGTARIENNIFLGGRCGACKGFEFTPGPAGVGAQVVNNYIDAGGLPGAMTVSRGIFVEARLGTGPSGTFLNNVIVRGVGADPVAIHEIDDTADMAYFYNNDLVSAGSLYRDEGITTADFTTAAEMNGLNVGPESRGNVSVGTDVDLTFHLRATSPLRGAGAASTHGVLAASTDFDGEARPLPSGTSVDIGPDERN